VDNNNEYMFTVIIPVKNRADYLYHTLQTCIIQDYHNFQVIVSDDCSTDNLKNVVEEAARIDPRIKYVTPNEERSVGMRDNFEYALSLVTEGYVLALGGDDGLLPYSISKIITILKQTQQLVISWPASTYIYPGAGIATGQLMLNTNFGRLKKGHTILKTKDFLERQAINLSYASDLYSPMFYVKGAVSIDLINKTKARSSENRFYVCPTPDGYSGIVIAGEIDTYAYSHEPLSLFGLSSSSQGMNYLSSEEKAIKNSEAFFTNVSKVPMHKELASQPYSPLIALMTADYLLTARDLPGWTGKFPAINFKEMILKSIEELSHGLYSDNRLDRELKILYEIAVYHGLEDFYIKTLSNKRRYAKKMPIEGNAIAINKLFLDCTLFEINNILEAAYTVSLIYRILPKSSVKTICNAILNSIRFKINSKKRGDKFPIRSAWR
jgi:glycosyltransferase involved in cell wall biosynthesis